MLKSQSAKHLKANPMPNKMFRFWISWRHNTNTQGPFNLQWPWWVEGVNGDDIIYAAVIAKSPRRAKHIIHQAYANREAEMEVELDYRFFEVKPEAWTPFSERFPRQDWMVWP